MAEQYGFSAQPKMVRGKQTKYIPAELAAQESRELKRREEERYQNLMFERRVVRGNTYSAYVMSKEDELNYKASQPIRSKGGAVEAAKMTIDATLQNSFNQTATGNGTLERWADNPPKGMSYAKCFVDSRLLMETDLPPYHDATTQTDYKIEKDIPDFSVEYNYRDPKKWKSKETQIYPGELPFDFEYEAEPLIQVLMTRILEESRIEVLEEQELDAMRQRQQYIIAHKAEVRNRLEALEQKERETASKNVDLFL